MRGTSGRRILLTTLGTALVLLVGGGPPAWAQAEPTVFLEPARIAVGRSVAVRLSGWPAGNVAVEVCGNQALRGSIDCAVSSAASTAVGAAGTAVAVVGVVRPPIGCPCVVRVRPVAGGAARTAPLAIAGAPTLKTPVSATQAPAKLAARDVTLSGRGMSWASLFAGPGRRSLTATVHNTGDTPVLRPRLAVTQGRPGETTTIVDTFTVMTLGPKQQQVYQIPIDLGAPTWGRYTVRGELTGGDEPVVFYAHTYSYPWALMVLALGLGTFLLLRIFRCFRAGSCDGTGRAGNQYRD